MRLIALPYFLDAYSSTACSSFLAVSGDGCGFSIRRRSQGGINVVLLARKPFVYPKKYEVDRAM